MQNRARGAANRRRTPGHQVATRPTTPVSAMEFIKNTDLFKRVKSELTAGWAMGGILSVLGSAFMVFLVISEIGSYLSYNTVTNVQMSGDMDTQLLIQFNVSMPRLPCAFASVDVRDVIGTSKMNMTKDIRKWKLHGEDSGGGGSRLLGDAVKRGHEMNDDLAAPKHEDEGAHPEDPVEKAQALNTANFDSFVAANEIVLVNYAPWCHRAAGLCPLGTTLHSLSRRKPTGTTLRLPWLTALTETLSNCVGERTSMRSLW